jgi:hypothetical protein
MSELIAIPLESDRRAVEVLATLRRLQAEYRGASGGSGGAGDGALPLGFPLGRRRRLWRCLRSVALASLIGGVAALVAGLAVAVRDGAPAPGLPQLGSVPAQALLTGGGLLIGAACATLIWLLHRRTLPRMQSPRTVTWLVSYIMQDGPSPRGSAVRASVFQITLPVEAEGRLKAILARADATAAH